MHQQVSGILEREVVGEVTQVAGALFDVALGRVCLTRLDRGEISELIDRLRQRFGSEIRIDDRLHLGDTQQPIRGITDVYLPDPDLGTLYQLQITSHPVVSLYERRFTLEGDTTADLRGFLYQGFAALLAEASSGPLKVLADYDALYREYLAALDRAVHAASDPDGGAEGIPGENPADELQALLPRLRRAYRLLPWQLHAPFFAAQKAPPARLCRHDPELIRTVLFSKNLADGELTYEYIHRITGDDYQSGANWLGEVFSSLRAGATARHATVLARASSVDQFIHAFPGFDVRVDGRVQGASRV